jgi:hypothetical protein
MARKPNQVERIALTIRNNAFVRRVTVTAKRLQERENTICAKNPESR